MKSFTFALLACAALARRNVNMNVKDDVVHAVEHTRTDIEHAIEDAPREIEREMSQIAQELECWWADRNNGDGDCQKRRQEAESNECY